MGLFLALSGCSSAPAESEKVGSSTQAWTAAELSMLGFEQANQWTAVTGPVTLASSSLHSQGSASLSLSGLEYAQVRNVLPLTKDTSPTPEVVSFDIRVPSVTPNVHWRGAVELYIDAPSVGVWGQYLGYRSLQDVPKDVFTKLEFAVPNAIQTKLQGNYTDLKFTIALNVPAGSQAHLLDRFVIGPDVPPPVCVPVNDNNPCTADDCDTVTNQPIHTPLAPGALCSDGNACNGVETCSPSAVCTAGTPPTVDDGNVCTADACSPSSGVTHTPVATGTSCTDGNACNGNETCNAAGACSPGTPPNLDDNNPCTADACSPGGGVTHTPVSAGTSCSDANACNGSETCNASGACVAGTAPTVDDGNPCTADSCDAVTGVAHVAVSAGTSCDDGNACNGLSVCSASAVCTAGTPPVVDDGNPCTADSCDASLGVVHVAVAAGTSCDDGNACNGTSSCDGAGSCQAGTPPVVDDGNPCTADACSPSGGVTHTPVATGTSCADGNACNGAETCNAAGSCVAGSAPVVDDGNPCTADACSPSGGVTHTPVSAGTSCADANACNGAEACNGSGTCVAGTPPVVDDGNVCTVDSCDPTNGVTHVAANAGTSCGDANVCNGAETCDGAGACQAGVPLDLTPPSACVARSCDPVTGVVDTAAADGTSCGDGNACTQTDQCQAGVCVGSNPITCFSTSPCLTAGECNPSTGQCTLVQSPDGTACDDGNLCTTGDACQSGTCEATAIVEIPEQPCAVGSCDPLSGAVVYEPLETGSACDLDACTAGACSAEGECIPAGPLDVDDGDDCTIDRCDPETGIVRIQCGDLDPTVGATVFSSTSWIYSGPNAIQTGVAPGTIEMRRAALVRGQVRMRDGTPIPSARVSVFGHPELGETTTHANGTFDLVVNGGGLMQIVFSKEGYLDSSRQLNVRWNQTHTVDEVVLIPPDPIVTSIELGGSSDDYQVAVGSIISDADGERQATLLIPPGVQALMHHADGSTELLEHMSVRLTEFTVGEEGPEAMPATLPANTGYTYAFEVNADEAVAAGAPEIEFSEPLTFYTNNFLDFPAGTVVPIGSYSRSQGVWIPHPNGVVLDVLSVSGGVPSIDITGDGVAESAAALNTAGILAPERERIASLYPDGASLWRVKIPHFTQPYDCNWPVSFPPGATGPTGPEPKKGTGGGDDGGDPNSCKAVGSVIECQNRVYRESIPLVGTPYSLNYSSRNVEGFLDARTITIPLTEATVPAALKRVDVVIDIAGRQYLQSFGPEPNQSTQFVWDRIDAYGRPVRGRQAANVSVRYAYDGLVLQSSGFGRPSGAGTPLQDLARGELYWERRVVIAVGAVVKDPGDLGGWSLSSHHSYEPTAQQLYQGHGEFTDATGMSAVARELFTTTGLSAITVGPDGSFYFGQGSRVYRRLPNGTTVLIAGNGNNGTSGDGGPATAATLEGTQEVALGADGSVYIAGVTTVRRVDMATGIISRIAGTGVGGSFNGDNLLATATRYSNTEGLAIAPDGSVYFSASGHNRVFRVGPEGISNIVAGSGARETNTSSPVNVPARQAIINPQDLAFDEQGTLYILHHNDFSQSLAPDRIYSVQSDGILRVVYQAPTSATESLNLLAMSGGPSGIVVSAYRQRNSSVFATRAYLLDVARGQLHAVGGTEAQGVQFQFRSGDAALSTQLDPRFVASGPSGVVYARTARHVGIVDLLLPGLSGANLFIPSEDRNQIFGFDAVGRHLTTLQAQTAQTLESFEYNTVGRITSITDAFGNETRIERNSAGAPTAIVGEHGERNVITLAPNGFIASVTNPADEAYRVTYGEGDLIATFENPKGFVSRLTFDERGRLVRDENGAGEQVNLARTLLSSGWTVTKTTRLGAATEYETTNLTDGTMRTRVVQPDGTETTSDRLASGVVTTELSDGTRISTSQSADPRFGLASPVMSSTTTLPSGAAFTQTTTRTVVQPVPTNPFSLTTETNTNVVAGQTYSSVYTAATRTTVSRTPENRTSQIIEDVYGRITESRPAGAPRVRMQYTGDDLTGIIVDPDGVLGNADDRKTQVVFNSTTGHLTKVIDPLTKEILFGDHDGASRPETITFSDTSQIVMSYDEEGNVNNITPPGKAAHVMTHGVHGRVVNYSPPLGNGIQFTYDLDARMDLIDFGGDALNQPNQVDFVYNPITQRLASILSPTGEIEVGYTDGQMTSLVALSKSGPITSNIAYDGLLVSSMGWSGPVSGNVNWTYNSRFLMQSETIGALPSTTATYTYDRDGLVTQAGALTITRNSVSGQTTQRTVGNIRESYLYNSHGELSRQTVVRINAGGTVVETLYDVVYDTGVANGRRDALGRITKKTERIVVGDVPVSGARALASKTYDYGYNADGRPWLESVTANGSVVSAYSYDSNGNRTSAELNWSSLGYSTDFDASLGDSDTEYDSADKLLRYGTKEYTWNAFGQLSSVTDTATNETMAYEYDLYGNLLSVALPDGRTIEYDVDGAGRRVGRHVLDESGNELEFRGWIYRDLLRPVAEVDSSGNIVARYVYGDAAGVARNSSFGIEAKLGLGESVARIHGAGRLSPRYVLEYEPGGAVRRLLVLVADEWGNVSLTIDAATGDVVRRQSYTDSGLVLVDSAPDLHPFGFGGGILDSATGLTRFGARDLDHITGRWLTRDPSGFKSGSPNLYLYADGDPMNSLDATGLATYLCTRDLGDYDPKSNSLGVWPKRHDYLCVRQGNHVICNGQGPTGRVWSPFGSPGRSTGDRWNPHRCTQIREDNACLESCIASRLESTKRPYYNMYINNCRDFVQTTLSECQINCFPL